MKLKNLFKNKQVFTKTFAGVTVSRRGYEDEDEYRWQGQAALLGLDCELNVTNTNDDEFRKAERQFLMAKQNEETIKNAIQYKPNGKNGFADVYHDHLTINYPSMVTGKDVYTTIADGENVCTELLEN